MNRKPDPNAMPPGAAEALKEAEESIGNRLLKTQDDYVAPPGHNTQLRVCITREEVPTFVNLEITNTFCSVKIANKYLKILFLAIKVNFHRQRVVLIK